VFKASESGWVAVPRNIMCSVKCDSPLSSGLSNLAPTLMKAATVAVCRCGNDTVVTRSPLGRVEVATSGSSAARGTFE
jgi:hypothetical protein